MTTNSNGKERLILLLFTILMAFVTKAQEYPNPVFQTDQFNSIVHYRQSVCDRQQWYDTGEITSLEYALEGIELRVAVGINQYFELDEDGKIDPDYPGLIGVILDELANRGKFTWRSSFVVVEGSPVEDSGRTWTDLLLWLTDTYDIAADLWIHTIERASSGVAYPESCFDASPILVGKNAQEEGEDWDPWSWLAPFDAEVWFAVLATLVLSGLLHTFLQVVDPYSDRRGEKLKNKPIQNIYLSALAFGGHMEMEPRTHPARLSVISLAMWALLMGAAYTANLASFLVVKSASTTTVDSLEDVVGNGESICVLGGSAHEEQLRKDFPNAVIIEKMLEVDIFQGVIDGECAVALAPVSSWEHWQRNTTVNKDCKLASVGQNYGDSPAGFGMASDSGTLCTSLIRDVINLHMLKMKKDGFIDDAWEYHLQRSGSNDCADESSLSSSTTVSSSNTNKSRQRWRSLIKRGRVAASSGESTAATTNLNAEPLNIKNMGGIFLMHGGLSAFAVVLALIHRWTGLTARRNKERMENDLRRRLKRLKSQRRLSMAQNPTDRREAILQMMQHDDSTAFTRDDDQDYDEESGGIISPMGSPQQNAACNFIRDDIDVKLSLWEENLRNIVDSRQDEQMAAMEELKHQFDETRQELANQMLTIMNTMMSEMKNGNNN